VIKNKTKGQGLVEFALILPLLLMLILGIIEGGRIIWAYVTVQNAAREAARYAVTGRPFACGSDPAGSPDWTVYCDDSSTGDPWSPQVLTTTRVAAIKEVARGVGRNLAVSTWADTDLNVYNANLNTPGAFGIAVIGQSAVYTQGLGNYAGEPGWNVRVETYYNVEMIDPIYRTIMANQVIHLGGQVELQNEGVDSSVKEYVGGITYQSDSCAPNCGGGAVPFITVNDEFNDFIEPAGGNFSVSINDHLPNTTYRLYFTNGTFTDFITFTTDGLGGSLRNFVISVSAPNTSPLPPTGSPDYKIYTALDSAPGSPIATCLGDMTNNPCFSVSGAASTIVAKNVNGTVSYGGVDYTQIEQPLTTARWPISSSIPIYLFGHDVNTNYTILFNSQPASAAPGSMTFLGANSDIITTDSQFGANQNSDPAYYIATNHSAGSSLDIESQDPLNNIVAGTSVDVSAPLTVRANASGENTVLYSVPHGVHEPGTPAVPVEIYTIDHGRGPNPNKIARRTITVYTPLNPYINVPGGARWPAGSPIEVQLRRHPYPPTTYEVYIEQGPAGSPTFSQLLNGTSTSMSPSIYDPNIGEANINYTIPYSLTGAYVLRSYDPADLSTPVAQFDLDVTANPNISIDGGNRWPPGATVTIRLQGHSLSTPYEVWLDNGGLQETNLGTIITDNNGEATVQYTIPLTMPSKISPEFYPIHSYLGNSPVATDGQLEVYPADLTVTNIELPPVTFDIEMPITVTVANTNPVAINNTWFDTDLYVDPPIIPDPLNQGLPPGDYKTWLSSIPANGTATIYDSIVLFGQQDHEIHARVDTSRNVFESNEGNNVTVRYVSAACPVEIQDEFDDGIVDPLWTQTDFGDSGPSCPGLADLPPPVGAGNTLVAEDWDGLSYSRIDNPSDGTTISGNNHDFIFDGNPSEFGLTPGSSDNFLARSSGGDPPSALFVGPGYTGSSEGSAGAWINFTNTQPDVTFSFKYLLRIINMESSANEWGEYYFIVDVDPSSTGDEIYFDGSTGVSTPTPMLRELGASGTNNTIVYPLGHDYNTQPWPQKSFTLTLPLGTHRVFVGAKASPMSWSDEEVSAYLDDLQITQSGGSTSPPADPAGTIWSAHYDTDQESFNFAADQFYGLTSQGTTPPSGSHDGSQGAWQAGSLFVDLGNNSSGQDMNGAWSRTFDITDPGGSCVTIQGYYRMQFAYYDTSQNEYAEVLLAVNDAATPQVLDTLSGGDDNTVMDTGWQSFNVSVNLPQGTHTLYLGGLNNSSSQTREYTHIWFDDVYVVNTGAGSATSAQSESGGVLSLSNKGSSPVADNDNSAGAGYHFMHRQVGTGPFEAYVRLDRPAIIDSNARAGLEVRADTTGNASKLMFVYRNDGRLQVLSRQSGASIVSQRTSSVGNILPVWLRISRNGDTFDFEYVSSGSDTPPAAASWTNFTSVSNFTLPDTVEVGLLNAPDSTVDPTTGTDDDAQFKHFHICAASAPGGSSGVGTGYLGSRCGEVQENGNGLVVIDAVNTILNQSGGSHVWQSVSMNDVLGEPSMEGLEVSPDNNSTFSSGVGPHTTYQVDVQTAGTYYVWVAGWGPDSNGNDAYIGLNGQPLTLVDNFPTGGSAPDWRQMPGTFNVSAGINTIHLWAHEDGARVFKILLTTTSSFSPPDDGMAQSACSIIAQPHIPPNLRICSDPIRRGDFEGTVAEVTNEWKTENLATAYSTVAYQSNHASAFPVFSGRQPRLSQAFDLPTWVLTDTTAVLNLQRGVDLNYSGVSTATDQLYFTLRWESEPAPPAAGFDLISPTLILDGVDRTPSIPDLNSGNPTADDWTTFTTDLFQGINPLSVLEPGARVRAYFYTANPGSGSAFYVDDVSLEFCTTQPVPTQVSGGQISGFTRRSGNPLVGATVWAYAYSEDGSTPGPVFKTYSVQNGSFSFYNLPPGSYLIYASITDASGSFFATQRIQVLDGSDIKNVILNVITG